MSQHPSLVPWTKYSSMGVCQASSCNTVPDFVSWKRNQLERCESTLPCKASAVNGDEWEIQLKNTLLIQMKMLMHILFAASNQAIQTSCTMSRKLPGQAEIISVC